MASWQRGLATGVLLALAASAGRAQPAAPEAAAIGTAMDFTTLDRAEGLAGAGHPNEWWRVRALRALKLGQPQRAADEFRMAARYADKYSQHALSLMHWHGVGVERDRAAAYAWSDLAAERGYHDLLLVREKMWLELAPADRERALALGAALYAEFGDDVARPRTDWALRRARSAFTGSRVGYTTDRVTFMAGLVDRFDVDPRDFFADERWDRDAYRQAEDREWRGRVLVLPPERAEDAAAPGD